MADWIDGDAEEPPPELSFYLQVRDWGAPWEGGWMKWPARLFVTARLVRNVYNAWSSYAASSDRVKWLNEHPSGAEIVGLVKDYRYGTDEPEIGRMERWTEWQTGASSTS